MKRTYLALHSIHKTTHIPDRMKIKPTHVTLLLAGSLSVSLFTLHSQIESQDAASKDSKDTKASKVSDSASASFQSPEARKAKAKEALLSRLGQQATKDPLNVGNTLERIDSAPILALRSLPKAAKAEFKLGDLDVKGSVMLNTPEDEHGNWLFIVSLDDMDGATLKLWNDERYGMGGSIANPQGSVAYQIQGTHDGLEYEVKNVAITDLICGTAPEIGLPGTHAVPAAEEDSSAPVAPDAEPTDSSTLSLQSLPGSQHTLYLDFDGEVVNAAWWNNGNTINASASRFNNDHDIQQIWRTVKEDYLPFNINVTTDRSVYDATSSSNRMMVVFTDTYQWYKSVAGVAYRNSFGSSYAKVCWVFTHSGDPLHRANTASHESGHTMGLQHDGSSSTSYYTGHAGTTAETSWRPIMGTQTRAMVTWDNGSYANANNTEDDLAKIASVVGLRPNNASSIAALTVDSDMNIATEGSILMGSNNRPETSDIYSFSCGAGTVNINLHNYPLGTEPSNNKFRSDLDLKLEVLDSSGNVVLSDMGVDKRDASVSGQLAEGSYKLRVTTTEVTGSLGYPTYGQMGEYSITGNLPTEPFTLSPMQLANEVSFEGSATSQSITLTHKDSSNMAVNVTSSAAWVSATPDSFTSTSGSTTNITVNYDAAGLSIGTHNATLTVTVGSNAPVSIPVSFEVTPLGNYDGILISGGKATTADVYPSSFDMPAATGAIKSVSVLLDGVSHTNPKDLQVLLVSPSGNKVMLLDGNGGSTAISNAKMTFNAQGQTLPGTLSNGTYLPSGPDGGTTNLPSPAPAGTYSGDITSFNGDSPSGNWQLYVNDIAAKNGGSIDGWAITVETEYETLIATSYTQIDGSTSSISFRSTPGLSYTIESSLDMSNWNSETQLTATKNQTTVTVSTSESTRRFFRVRENS
ncbi:hypothetical protein Rhal01_03277 [Rubritalea halochordaticola]|uniref:P/Homo B domain-containing protein n=2 Tax=Rubritalea halochordaticola TaxID=714537 RepID=A0ABP9V353_9BACT